MNKENIFFEQEVWEDCCWIVDGSFEGLQKDKQDHHSRF